ncbi:DUF3306 domain-containing protein [Ramlibacter tataouinensis]|uniref:DUF3306 domain-containing protein n=1 Tax=Ramlibacter tataouinensis (strain ATCC BAA-407 / DSM 14655 / LMG 21543 / TTB310) TaxID=365046 RepID=F5XWM3_RAMTT|nr:DUF3306 domain-containing protein [Ramlibacter tataouinensis]AEG94167.1 conserved hypothetical protein [Ramlibacter tataouinensis TTB310]
MADGFLGRWSRRKLDAKEGRPAESEPLRAVEPPAPPPQPSPSLPPPAGEGKGGSAPAPAEPPPTLEDVQALTPQSDFSRFTGAQVTPEVRNAAMKKLFADPRFNVMDGLDVYIDDYSKPDPLPESMLRQLASARFLGMFREEERKDEIAEGTRDDADRALPQSVAQSQTADAPVPAPSPASPPADHADPDLRLQQDHAAPGPAPGRGTG